MKKLWPEALRQIGVCCVLLGLLVVGSARAELPPETLGVAVLPPDNGQRLFINDPTMPHIVDGRVHVVDGETMRYLGMIGVGFAASSSLSNDRKSLFVATSYLHRLRGPRTDVVEAYRTSDLTLEYEIEIPPKRAQALQLKALVRQSADGRFLLVQNATPATSVTVIDLESRKVLSEIPTPGCWGVLPWLNKSARFSTICGDGTLATIDLDSSGLASARSVSERFFDPDKDPIFMHYEMVGSTAIFISYEGLVRAIDLSGDKPVFPTAWSLLDAAGSKQGWRPGGFALFVADEKSGRLLIGMHAKGTEGSHKQPAEQLWLFDLNSRQRLTRVPGHATLSMALTRGEKPRLMLLSATDNTLRSFDWLAPRGLEKPLRTSEPIGETPVYLEAQ